MKPAVQIVRALLLGMLGLAATLVLVVVTLLYLSIDSKPLVFGSASLTHAHIERAKRLQIGRAHV